MIFLNCRKINTRSLFIGIKRKGNEHTINLAYYEKWIGTQLSQLS